MMPLTSTVSIIGCGFVGLSLAVVCAKNGLIVYAVDNDEDKIKSLNDGKPPFFEPNMQQYISSFRNNLIFTTNTKEAVLKSNIIFVTVGTPQTDMNDIDLTYIENVCNEIGNSLKHSDIKKLVVIKSTVIPGTSCRLGKIIESVSGKKLGGMILIASNPEFLREGYAISDMENPHLIVIGTNNEKAKDVLTNFYKTLYNDRLPKIIYCNEATAELIKYANNAFLATKISFINSIANICQKIPGADINLVADAMGEDKRIGREFLNAGPGFGGSCLPKDICAFLNFSQKMGFPLSIISAVNEVNENQSKKIIEISKEMIGSLADHTVSILGLAFKKNTDDVRNSVSLSVIKQLLDLGSRVVVHDPMATENVRSIFGQKIKYADSIRTCIYNSELCIILTEWDEYKKLLPVDFKSMKCPNVIDARRIFEPKQFMKEINFRAIGLGL